MEVNLVVLVGFIMSIIALTLACINIYKLIKALRFTNIKDITHIICNNYKITEQEFAEILMSSRNLRVFHRKLKKYIKCKNK